jgi:nucleotide-binding universal stress UspA family protein
VRVVTAFQLPPSALDIPPVQDYYRALHDEADAIAGDARSTLAARWPAVETLVREGDAREIIADVAGTWQADLVVVGARGLGGVTGALLGSVSTAVVRDVHCPVLVVKGRPTELRRAVVALDGSEGALAGARFLAGLPLPRSLRVRLLAVVDRPPVSFAPEVILGTTLAAINASVETHRERMSAMVARVARDFGDAADVEQSVVVGRPGDEIVAASAESGVDLVVVGARGLGRLERLVLGSVSERVLHRAPCSVLVVKSKA